MSCQPRQTNIAINKIQYSKLSLRLNKKIYIYKLERERERERESQINKFSPNTKKGHEEQRKGKRKQKSSKPPTS